MGTRQRLSLTANEKISIGLSALALLFSIVTAYLTFFYQDHDVLVRIVSSSVDHDSDGGFTLTTNVAFVNRGNQTAMVTGGESFMRMENEPDEGALGQAVDSNGALPLVLEKGQSKLVRVSERLARAFGPTPGAKQKFIYGLKIASLDGAGQERGAKLNSAVLEFVDGNLVTANLNAPSSTQLFESVAVQTRAVMWTIQPAASASVKK